MKEREQAGEAIGSLRRRFDTSGNLSDPALWLATAEALLNYVEAVDDALNDATANGSFY